MVEHTETNGPAQPIEPECQRQNAETAIQEKEAGSPGSPRTPLDLFLAGQPIGAIGGEDGHGEREHMVNRPGDFSDSKPR